MDGSENGIRIPCVRNTMALLKLASFIYLSTQVVKVISIGDLAPRAFRIIVIISRNSLSPFNNRHAESGVYIYIYIHRPVAYVSSSDLCGY